MGRQPSPVGGVPVKLIAFPILAMLTIAWIFYVPTALEGFDDKAGGGDATADGRRKAALDRIHRAHGTLDAKVEAGDHEHEHDHTAPLNEFPACYTSSGRYAGDTKYAGTLHRVFEQWNGRPLYRRRDGNVWLGQQATGIWAIATSRSKLIVRGQPTYNAAALADCPEAVEEWVETGSMQKFPQLKVMAGKDVCGEEMPDCFQSMGSGPDFLWSGFFKDTGRMVNGAPLYHRPWGSWWRSETWLAMQRDGRWGMSDQAGFVNGTVGSTYQTVAAVARPDGDGGWAASGTPTRVVAGMEMHPAWGDCHGEAPPPLDTVMPWGEPGDITAVNGTHFLAEYDPKKMVDDPKAYAYPADRAFTYLMDRRPTLPSTMIALQPRVVFFEKFLTEADCDEIIAIARQSLRRSEVSLKHAEGNEEGGKDDVRTSWQTWLAPRHPPVRRLMDRILAVTGFRREEAESLQILRYSTQQKFDAHTDYFDPDMYGPQNNNRAITCFIYFNTVEAGGWTWFPKANNETMAGKTTSSCNAGLRTIPRKGSVACFYDMRPDRSLDPASLHAGCPVIKGEKWGGTLWLHKDTPLDTSSEGKPLPS